LPDVVRAGRLHMLHYPVEITGVLLPYAPIKRFLESDLTDPLRVFLSRTISSLNRTRSFGEMETWLGLHSYPEQEGHGPFFVPFRDGQRPERRMGMTLIEGPNGVGFTISCAQCHSSNLFGRRVLGLTNRFPRANRFFVRGQKGIDLVSPGLFQWSTKADEGEMHLFRASKRSLKYVQAKRPVQLGLDTSLAQVALSLAKREPDAWASRDGEVRARDERLAKFVADSKPAVWWNVKYKNRWLSDGSVVSGNPIYTNILWNEIGRGTDLHYLDRWLTTNQQKIRELTTSVFSVEAPRWTDFFSPETIDLSSARRGQLVYQNRCAKCHGEYEKAWDRADAHTLSAADLLRTTRVTYKPKKPVVDVGTDPQRYLGMASLEQLNRLEISKRNGIVIELQKGYVPPPLVGIWARWPYFHNNSAPSLCAVLTPEKQRPLSYWAREAVDPDRDFDRECNGYPNSTPPGATREYVYDTRRTGLSNRGHDERILTENGQDLLSADDKRDLIRFLQTL
ncbi:MAG: hypothetical protein NDI61_14245, partial [Bdellovibrionaceae bacterium]|nr:hypothetical protein [Pseudobdellovibrionaceae bacterium]